MDRFLTKAQLARKLQISALTIERWVRNKGFPEMRLGPRTKRYNWTDVEKWIASNTEFFPISGANNVKTI